ncbi:nuclear transport factor 2 family protein [Streptomyces sp. NPDC001635]
MAGHERLVQRLFTVIDEEHWDALPQLFTESVRYERPGYPPICGIYALTTFYRNERVVAHGRHEIHGCLSGGDQACCWGQFSGLSRSGDSLVERFADWYWITDGLISERRTFFYRPAI